jgi:hypothetical protein
MPVKRVLFLGDVCAKPGREAVVHLLPPLRQELDIHFVIANGENAARGYGITPAQVQELLNAGVDCITTGDHFLDRKEIEKSLDSESRLLRPLNYPAGVPGKGLGVFACAGAKIGVVNLLGRVFLKPIDSPFEAVLPALERIRQETRMIIVDFHAEATAEKLCLGWYLAGRVSGVLGTHTHVATADERILPGGTAYISDAGMCGGLDSVLGMRRDLALRRMMLSIPLRLEPSRENVQVGGVVLEIDDESGQARAIRRIARRYEPGPESNAEPASQTP